jgi:hypothetical protein
VVGGGLWDLFSTLGKRILREEFELKDFENSTEETLEDSQRDK